MYDVNLPNILSFDPGGMTGIAHYVRELSNVGYVGRFMSTQLPADDVMPFVAKYYEAQVHCGNTPIVVAYERYNVRRSTHQQSAQHDAEHHIGAIKAFCEQHGIKCDSQGAGEAKHVGTTALLKRIHFWKPRCGHANDAARHALLALIRIWPYEAGELVKGARLVV